MNDQKLIPERGEASLLIELKDGTITIKHGTDGDTLYESLVTNGTWTKMFAGIKTTILENRLYQ